MYDHEQDTNIHRLADEFEADHAFAAPPEPWSLEDLADLHGRYQGADPWN